MRIETERLLLRNYRMTDLQAYIKLMTQEKVANHAGFFIKSTDRLLYNLKDECDNDLKFAIVLKDSDKVIGEIGLTGLSTKYKKLYEIGKEEASREVEFCLSEEYWGKGYMTEALKALVKVGFEELLLDSIVAARFSKNEASKKVQIKCGLIPFKTDKNYVWMETGESCKVVFSKMTKKQYKHIDAYKKLSIKVTEDSSRKNKLEQIKNMIDSSADVREL